MYSSNQAIKIDEPTHDIPVDQQNLSPALAGMFAQLTMPHAYRAVVQTAVISMNARSPLTAKRIQK